MHLVPSPQIRRQLRAATGPAHEALEAQIGPLTTRPAYETYLRGIHAFRTSVEDWLARNGSKASGWTPQSISPHIRADLTDLRLTPIIGPSSTWGTRDDDAFSLGVHYVLEGSALGARVLCKQVAALGLHGGHGARHLWAQADAPESWRGFLDVLNAYDGDEAPLVAGANAAFHAAADAMERAAHV